MPFTFDAIQAFDPTDPKRVAADAEIIIHAPDDPNLTPIEITDVTGLALPNPYLTNDLGSMPAFVANIERVAWASGEMGDFLTSWEGMRDTARDARIAAEVARDEAAASAGLVDAPAGDVVIAAIGAGGAAEFLVRGMIAESLGLGGNGSGVVFGLDPDGTPVLVIANATTPPAERVAGLVATAGEREVALAWNPVVSSVDAITGYSVQYRASGANLWDRFVQEVPGLPSATVTGLEKNQEYEFRVAAENSRGPGEYSATTTATPVGMIMNGVVLTDEFNRTSPDIVGSNSTTGQEWTALAGIDGRIAVNGARAVSLGVSSHPAIVDYGSVGDATMKVTVRIPTDGAVTSADMYLYLKYIGPQLYVCLTVQTRASAVNIGIRIRSGEDERVVTTFPASTIEHGIPNKDYAVEFSMVADAVSATVNGITRGIAVLPAEAEALMGGHQAALAGSSAEHQWENLSITVDGTEA